MISLWIGFIAAVLALIALDLFVFHRKDKVVSVRSALKWSAFWVALAVLFSGGIYWMYDHHWQGLGTAATALHPRGLNGPQAAVVFLTGYVLELSLSVDNLFVIAVIFGYFAVPPKYQHRVLFWGIIGVLVMRGAMIGIGAALIARFQWVLYLFGLILLYTAYKMVFGSGESDPKNNPVLRFARRFFPVTHDFHGHHFAIRERDLHADEKLEESEASPAGDATGGSAVTGDTAPVPAPARGRNRWVLTPLALALIVVETTDLVFAVDSIPAIFGITDDPFLVFTSNVCAVLGLRSLFFALAGILEKFEYLKLSLAAILALVGVKMLAHRWLHDVEGMNFYLLGVVGLLLAAGVVASLLLPAKHTAA
ncbi:MAG: Inner rane protein alx, partial [Phycisphaerales bacterium]|nr:Inner rane protein alx [Phycisphaerales bacterium]